MADQLQQTLTPATSGGLATQTGSGEVITLLALDLGTTTGWALRLPSGQILSGKERFQNNRYAGGGMRYLKFRAWLSELLRQAHTSPDVGHTAVFFEEVRRLPERTPLTFTAGFSQRLRAGVKNAELPTRACR